MTGLVRRRAWPRFVVPFAVTALLGILWALASPVFSVPDENAHATKAIAQARGQIVGYTLPDVRHIIVDLPDGYEYPSHIMCFVYHSDVSAECAPELGDEQGSDWFNTWVGAYNPVYYALIAWPSLFFDGNASIYAMRIASALLAAVFVGLAYLAASTAASARWMPLAVAFSAAPMTVYLFGSVNPNGAEIAAAIALWAGLLRLLESFRDPALVSLPRWLLWSIVTAAAAVLVNARALGPLWVVIVVGFCLVAAGWAATKRLFTTPVSYAWIGAIAACGLFSLGWTFLGGSLSNQAEASDAPLVHGTFLQGFAHTLRTTPDYVQQAIGYFGWFDAPLPVWAYWLLIAAVAVVLVLAGTATGRRSTLVLLAALAVALFVPAFVQGYSVGQTGIIWQGRYALFLYHGVLIVAGWLLSRDAPRVAFLAPRITVVASTLLGTYGVTAFALVLVRYVIGQGAPLGEMLSSPSWQPPLGWLALLVAYTLVSAGAVLLLTLDAWSVARPESVAAAQRALETTTAQAGRGS